MTEEQKQKNVEYLKDGSLSDYQAAQAIAQLAKKNAHALFFLHLSIEKALKALFVQNISDFAPLSHNLLMLAQKCACNFEQSDKYILSDINEFNLSTRYPSEIDELQKIATDDFTNRYLTEGQRIQQWILAQLK